jgi:hypothetical protein
MDLNASSRVHGFNLQNKTYATGSTGTISVAIQAPSVELGVTGVATHIETFKRQFGIDPSSTTYLDATYAVYKDNVQTGYAYYVPTANRTFTGVAADGSSGTTATIGASAAPSAAGSGASSADAAYVRAYYAQANIRRLIDVIQNRSVILGTSPVASISATQALATTGGWNVNISAAAGTYVVTFLIEKINSVDTTSVNTYGQPGSVTSGAGLVQDLLNLSLYNTTGTLVPLTASTSAVKVTNVLPQVL